MNTTRVHVPQRLHLDRRAEQLIEQGEADVEDVPTPTALAAYLKVSVAWVNQARIGAYGPPYSMLDDQTIRYRKEDVVSWLKERTYRSTAETPERWSPNRGRVKVGDKFVSADDVLVAAMRLGFVPVPPLPQAKAQGRAQAQAAEQAQATPPTPKQRITRPTA
jgi:hypothetical protein